MIQHLCSCSPFVLVSSSVVFEMSLLFLALPVLKVVTECSVPWGQTHPWSQGSTFHQMT